MFQDAVFMFGEALKASTRQKENSWLSASQEQ
jgi:hypothetical protein